MGLDWIILFVFLADETWGRWCCRVFFHCCVDACSVRLSAQVCNFATRGVPPFVAPGSATLYYSRNVFF